MMQPIRYVSVFSCTEFHYEILLENLFISRWVSLAPWPLEVLRKVTHMLKVQGPTADNGNQFPWDQIKHYQAQLALRWVTAQVWFTLLPCTQKCQANFSFHNAPVLLQNIGKIGYSFTRSMDRLHRREWFSSEHSSFYFFACLTNVYIIYAHGELQCGLRALGKHDTQSCDINSYSASHDN